MGEGDGGFGDLSLFVLVVAGVLDRVLPGRGDGDGAFSMGFLMGWCFAAAVKGGELAATLVVDGVGLGLT